MLTPQIEDELQTEEETVEIPSKTYKVSEKGIAGFVDNKEAIIQAVYHILGVERYSCLIYDDDYGVELEQYIGEDLEYIEATIEDTLREALTQDERILDVQVTNVEKLEVDSVKIDFTVISASGDIEMEVEISA